MAITKQLKKVREIFPGISFTPTVAELSLYVFTHSPDDPGLVYVPKVDPAYEFQQEVLEALILGEVLNRPVYVHGHTGTGKTSQIAQFCARRGRELIRQNFDEHISRAELVGAPTVAVEGGASVVKFRYGSLATSMMRPATFLADEFDTGSPSSTVVLNPVLESAEPVLFVPETEEMIVPNRDWRVVATGNTDGVNPDPRGIYAGTQTQNAASLNRFAFRIEVDYNSPETERVIIERKYPGLPANLLNAVTSFTREYRKAFLSTPELSTPFSTRTLHNWVEGTIFTGSLLRAFKMTFLAAVPAPEKQTVLSLAQRVGVV